MSSMEWNHKKQLWEKECSRCKKVYEAFGDAWGDAHSKMAKIFYIDSRYYDELGSDCKACKSDRSNGRRLGIPVKELLEKQGNQCAICAKPLTITGTSATAMDHCHSSGKTRGVICSRCNIGMHYIDDDSWVEKATAYRDKFRG